MGELAAKSVVRGIEIFEIAKTPCDKEKIRIEPLSPIVYYPTSAQEHKYEL